jgi:hypothetical protein
MAFTRDQILAKRQRRYTECNGYRLQSLTLSEFSKWETSRIDFGKGKVTADQMATGRSRLLVLCLVDDAGVRLFEDSEYGLLDMLDAEIADVYEAAMRHCGFTESKVDEERKNSEPLQD